MAPFILPLYYFTIKSEQTLKHCYATPFPDSLPHRHPHYYSATCQHALEGGLDDS